MALTRRNTFGKNGFGAFGQRDLVLGHETTTPPLTLALLLLAACFLPLFFGSHRERFIEVGRRRAAHLLLEFSDAYVVRLELVLRCLELLLRYLELTLLRCEQID